MGKHHHRDTPTTTTDSAPKEDAANEGKPAPEVAGLEPRDELEQRRERKRPAMYRVHFAVESSEADAPEIEATLVFRSPQEAGKPNPLQPLVANLTAWLHAHGVATTPGAPPTEVDFPANVFPLERSANPAQKTRVCDVTFEALPNGDPAVENPGPHRGRVIETRELEGVTMHRVQFSRRAGAPPEPLWCRPDEVTFL